jgi:hypothetical protein
MLTGNQSFEIVHIELISEEFQRLNITCTCPQQVMLEENKVNYMDRLEWLEMSVYISRWEGGLYRDVVSSLVRTAVRNFFLAPGPYVSEGSRQLLRKKVVELRMMGEGMETVKSVNWMNVWTPAALGLLRRGGQLNNRNRHIDENDKKKSNKNSTLKKKSLTRSSFRSYFCKASLSLVSSTVWQTMGR